MCARNRRSGRTPTLLPNNNDDNLWLAQNVYLAIIRRAEQLDRICRSRCSRCPTLCTEREERKKKTGKVPAITLRRCYQVGVARRAEPPGTIIIVMGREQHNERASLDPAGAFIQNHTTEFTCLLIWHRCAPIWIWLARATYFAQGKALLLGHISGEGGHERAKRVGFSLGLKVV